MENSLKNLNDLKEYYKKLYVDQHIPFAIRRTSDGAMLLLNNDFKTYSFEALRGHPGNYRYTYDRLFKDERVEPGDFEVVSWAPIENLFNHPEKYFEGDQVKVNYRNQLTTKNMEILAPISLGELYDKISILEIKMERIKDEEKLKLIQKELLLLNEISSKFPIDDKLYFQLKKKNEALWGIEDNIRIKEDRKQYDEIFVKLARAVYITNDERSLLKKKINEKYGSNIVEVKSYKDYK